MDYIEQTGDWTAQERLEWVRTYKNIIDSKKKCCNSCDYKLIYDKGNITMCKQQVSNSLNSDIVNSDTFYCSYHKLRLNNE